MQLVAPDILADACGLSLSIVITGLVLGLALWLLGWWAHRFWIVLATTLVAGIYGLYEAEALRAQPLVAAVALALAAGLLALALVRLIAFLAGGVSGLLAVQAFLPNLDQPLICFIVSGLIGLLLFRWCIMVLTSLAGAVLVSYSVLCLVHIHGSLDAVAWTQQGAVLLNWLCGMVALLGFIFQFLLERRRRRKARTEEDDEAWDVLLGRPEAGWPARKAG